MTCPREIAEIILDIIKTGILKIRVLGWSKEPGRCAIEAEHLHNLPDLLNHFRWDLLTFYWETERPSYVNQSTPADLAIFEPLWKRLACHVPLINGEKSASKLNRIEIEG